MVDGEPIVSRGGNWFTRSLGAGYPEPEIVVEEVEKYLASESSQGSG